MFSVLFLNYVDFFIMSFFWQLEKKNKRLNKKRRKCKGNIFEGKGETKMVTYNTPASLPLHKDQQLDDYP